jgi:hypothetical protein
MTLEGIVIGLLAVLIGAAWATYGLKAFTILLPIWAFFVGLLAGANWGAEFLGEGFLGTVTSWIIGLVLGIVLALLSYFWYYGAIALFGGVIGYTMTAGLFGALGFDGIVSILAGLLVGVIFALGVILLAIPVWVVIFLTAASGAAAIVNGVLILFGLIKVEDIDTGLMEGLLRYGVIAIVAWIILAALGVFYQMRSIAQTAEGLQAKYAVERSQYRIA